MKLTYLSRLADFLLNVAASRSLETTSATIAQEEVMSNVRHGALALAFAAVMCATPEIASAQQMTISKFTFPYVQVIETCGADGLPNSGDGEFITITGSAEVVEYVKPSGVGEWDTRTRFTASGTGTDAAGTGSYDLHISQTVNANLASFGETMVVGKTMLIRQGENGTPDDLVAKVFVNLRVDGNGVPTIDLGRFESECR